MIGRRAGMRRLATAATGLLLAAAAPAQAQGAPEAGARAVSAVAADTIRVGDVVPVAVRLTVDAGERVVWPDTLPLSGDLAENAARVRERVDTLADGRLEATGVYSVAPWRPGEVPLGSVDVQVVGADEGTRTVSAALPVLEVASVLPEDTAGIEPRPARGVIGASWSWWRILLLVLLIAVLFAAGVWWLRRRSARRVAEVAREAPVSPRERVLARLQEARDSGLLDRGDMKRFYTQVSAALREYLESLNGAWSDDLTTTELLSRFRAQVGPAEATALARVLRPADQVKFARRTPDRDTAISEWESARAWAADFAWPPRRAVDERGEAA